VIYIYKVYIIYINFIYICNIYNIYNDIYNRRCLLCNECPINGAIKKHYASQAELGRQSQKDHYFKPSLGYIARSVLIKPRAADVAQW
jgi:hypothetical protein